MANVLGIDITQSTVRGALVRIAARKREPLRYLEVTIPQLGEEGSRETAIAGAVRELLEGLGERPDSLHVAMTGQHVSLRGVQIPEAAAKRAADVLPFELESQLPFPVEEAVIDYQPVRAADGQMTLLAATAPETAVEQELAQLTAAGIDPREMPPGGAALDGLRVPDAAEGEAWLIVHVESDYTDVCVVRDGRCELARTLDEGMEAAQQRPAAVRMSLVQTVSMYRSQGGPALAGVVVSGSGGDQASFVEWLGGLLALPAQPVHVPAPEGGADVSPIFGKAYALAARTSRREKRLNMRQGRFAAATGEGFVRRHAALLGACAAALVFAYIFSVWAEYRVLAAERDALAEELHDVTERQLREGTSSARRAKQLLDQLDKRDNPLPEFDAMQALGAISDAVDRSITHDARKLEIQLDESDDEGKFELSGSVPDLASRDKIANALEEHDCIQELEKGRTSSLPGKDVKTYALEGIIGCNVKPKKKKGGRRRGGKR